MQRLQDKLRKHRKGQLTIGDIAPVGLAIIVLVVLLGVGSLVVSNINDEVNVYDTINNETVNDSLVAVPTTVTTANTPVEDNSETLWLINTTSGSANTLTESTNYSVISYSNGQFNVTDVGGTLGAEMRINMTYNFENSTATDVLNKGNEGLQDLANWVPIIVVVVAAAIVIGLITRSLGRQFSGSGV